MSRQLPADCLNEIFEYLEQDKVSLYSSLLVNRLWCEISVRILWRDIWSFSDTVSPQNQLDVSLQIINILVACLPNESKDLLYKNGIIITTPYWKPPLFNYASFCKVLSIHEIDRMIQQFLEHHQFIYPQSLNYNQYLLSQEVLKMFMNQISSLSSLDYLGHVKHVEFTYFPGATNCLTNLIELTCSSDIQSEFFYRVSQLCRNIQSLTVEIGDDISDGLAGLISLQNNLKSVTLQANYISEDETEVITSSLSKFSSTLIKLKLKLFYIPLPFISTFKNLQELVLSYDFIDSFDDFDLLQHIILPQLKVVKLTYAIPNVEVVIKFLELNGQKLKELYLSDGNNSLYLAIAKFCPNLQTLSVVFLSDEIDTLIAILNSCRHLESMKFWCGQKFYLNEKEILKAIAEYSPENFYELKLNYFHIQPELLLKNLESFLISWNNRTPKRSLSLIIIKERINLKEVIDDEYMKLIEKYKKLGIIKKFEIEVEVHREF